MRIGRHHGHAVLVRETPGPSEVGADRTDEEKVDWVAAMTLDAAAVARETDDGEIDQRELAIPEVVDTNGHAPAVPPDEPIVASSSEFTVELNTHDVVETNGHAPTTPLEEPTSHELADSDGDVPTTHDEPTVGLSSDRALALESEHWRERAIVWRERATAAELVAKMLQENLDDLRANLEDLRVRLEAAAAVDAARTAAIASAETPWRRFAREMYERYLS